jgi:hypothetical protein
LRAKRDRDHASVLPAALVSPLEDGRDLILHACDQSDPALISWGTVKQ